MCAHILTHTHTHSENTLRMCCLPLFHETTYTPPPCLSGCLLSTCRLAAATPSWCLCFALSLQRQPDWHPIDLGWPLKSVSCSTVSSACTHSAFERGMTLASSLLCHLLAVPMGWEPPGEALQLGSLAPVTAELRNITRVGAAALDLLFACFSASFLSWGPPGLEASTVVSPWGLGW